MLRARISVNTDDVVAPVARRLFGSFVEHLGRCVYDGLYEPGHPTADADGFRLDVADLVRELGVSTIRYPGGNFVSAYRWEDGVGPREQRPRRRDLAWHSTETNAIGIDEFMRWSRLVDAEVMLAVNLGTRGILEALDLQEYVNAPVGTALADQRAANGSSEPYDIRMWCLGNEMDGEWQVGHLSADAYGGLAARTAQAMKLSAPHLELVACGSSSAEMATFGTWERTVLEHTYPYVDYISCHAYYQEHDGDLPSFLGSSVEMEQFIRTVVAAADHVQHTLHAERSIYLSFDEWNVWYQTRHRAEDRSQTEWPIAPRLLEDIYTAADAVVVGSLLITLLKNSDRVRSASLAQLVNAIAPIMTEPGGIAWRQTTFYPFATTSRLARGRVLLPRIDSPLTTTGRQGEVALVDAVATYDPETGDGAYFLVNRSSTEPVEVEVTSTQVALPIESALLHEDDAIREEHDDGAGPGHPEDPEGRR